MAGNELLLAWLSQPFLVQFAWISISILFLYIARAPAHSAIRSIGSIIDSATRQIAKSLRNLANKLRQRNREVLLEIGQRLQERLLEREFKRVYSLVKRDLSGYPILHLTLSEQITRIEEDYRSSGETPPSPPDWLEAIDAVAKISARDNPALAKILDSIHQTLINCHKETLDTYRNASKNRHELLQKMAPYWRKLAQTMDDVGKKIHDLEERIPAIDEQMMRFEHILARSNQAERTLSSSFLTQFFTSGIVLTIALMAGFINFHLIALPMADIVGSQSNLGPLKTADVAAVIIILIEIVMGIFLMESLRVTRLFPIIHSMDDHTRRRLAITAFAALFILAGVEAALAYMRDILIISRESLAAVPLPAGGAELPYQWIALLGQMIMGFILPLLLVFIAIPLESFIHSSRTLIGTFALFMLNMTAFSVRLLGTFANHIAEFCTRLYDLLIFIPLTIERFIRKQNQLKSAPTAQETSSINLPQLFDYYDHQTSHSVANTTENKFQNVFGKTPDLTAALSSQSGQKTTFGSD